MRSGVLSVLRPMLPKPVQPRRQGGAVERNKRDWPVTFISVLHRKRQNPLGISTFPANSHTIILPQNCNSPERPLLVRVMRPAFMQQLPAWKAVFHSLNVSQLTVNEHEDVGSLVPEKC